MRRSYGIIEPKEYTRILSLELIDEMIEKEQDDDRSLNRQKDLVPYILVW